MKYELNLLSRYFFSFIVGIIFIFFISLGLFLYKNFYQTIASPEPIYLSPSQIAPEKINTALFDTVGQRIKDKKNGIKIDWDKLPNPFTPY